MWLWMTRLRFVLGRVWPVELVWLLSDAALDEFVVWSVRFCSFELGGSGIAGVGVGGGDGSFSSTTREGTFAATSAAFGIAGD